MPPEITPGILDKSHGEGKRATSVLNLRAPEEPPPQVIGTGGSEEQTCRRKHENKYTPDEYDTSYAALMVGVDEKLTDPRRAEEMVLCLPKPS